MFGTIIQKKAYLDYEKLKIKDPLSQLIVYSKLKSFIIDLKLEISIENV